MARNKLVKMFPQETETEILIQVANVSRDALRLASWVNLDESVQR